MCSRGKGKDLEGWSQVRCWTSALPGASHSRHITACEAHSGQLPGQRRGFQLGVPRKEVMSGGVMGTDGRPLVGLLVNWFSKV